MKTERSRVALSLFVFLAVGVAAAYAQGQIQLPPPRTDGGKPLMQVLNERKSAREFSSEKLPLPTLSNLLWAAFGINRATGQRTAPSANNRQEIDVYVATADGLYLYDGKANQLKQILAEDIRALCGTQAFVKDAPVNLIYVADLAKAGRTRSEDIEFYSGANTAFIAQNVYLFCASEGLATVVRANIDRSALAKAMKLRTDQKIALSQTVGYPKK
ncbi:MAG: SagB/ThcOx family dehydrogenase [Acidobacteriia bacterium]|nr:SagB/ThcOx family dehydrogenase [Terriglobia bacterium]